MAAIVELVKAVEIIPSYLHKVAIFLDSQTAFKLIGTLNWNAKVTDLQEIRELLDSLSKVGVAVAFQHILSHLGIHYNEKDDSLAVETA